MNNAKLALIAIVTITLGLLLLVPTGMDSELVAIILTVLSIGVLLTVSFIYTKNAKKHIVIDRENNTAILLQRSKVSASELHCIEVCKYNYDNHDAEIVYTGASVGGIHTGGFHVNEAHTSMTIIGKTDRAYISAKYNDESIEITKIKLTPQLLNEAKSDDIISKFIVKDCIILKNKGKETELTALERDMLSNAIERHDLAAQYLISERARIALYLPTSDIKYIINWVSGR